MRRRCVHDVQNLDAKDAARGGVGKTIPVSLRTDVCVCLCARVCSRAHVCVLFGKLGEAG